MLNVQNKEYKFQVTKEKSMPMMQCCIMPVSLEFILNDALMNMMVVMDALIENYRKENPLDPYGEPSPKGYAWVEIHGLKPNSSKEKVLKFIGFKRNPFKAENVLEFYPSNYINQVRGQTYLCNSLNVQEEGCKAFIQTLKQHRHFSRRIFMHAIPQTLTPENTN